MILVIGDVMVDEYVTGRVRRVSQEAPIPLLEWSGHQYQPGGAANVALNCQVLGHDVKLIGVVGADTPGHWLRGKFPVLDNYLMVDHTRNTTLKTRYVDDRGQQILRVDREQTDFPLVISTQKDKILDQIALILTQEVPSRVQCLVLSDYAKGMLERKFCCEIIDIALHHDIPIVVDPKGKDWTKYRGATVITPNSSEIEATGQTAGQLCVITDSIIVETLGKDGALIHRPTVPAHPVPSPQVDVASTIGLGDVFVSVIAHELHEGRAIRDLSVRRACHAASRAATRRGTSVMIPGDYVP